MKLNEEEIDALEVDLTKSNLLLDRGFLAGKDLDDKKTAIRQKKADLMDAKLTLKNNFSLS